MRILLFYIFLAFCFSGCRKKECKYVKLKKIECGKGCSLVKDAVNHSSYNGGGQTYKNYIIDDQAMYDSILTGSGIFENTDFQSRTLLGIVGETDKGNEIRLQSYVCQNDVGDLLIFTGEYALKGRCKGSFIDNYGYSFWSSVPKISKNQTVEFRVKAN